MTAEPDWHDARWQVDRALQTARRVLEELGTEGAHRTTDALKACDALGDYRPPAALDLWYVAVRTLRDALVADGAGTTEARMALGVATAAAGGAAETLNLVRPGALTTEDRQFHRWGRASAAGRTRHVDLALEDDGEFLVDRAYAVDMVDAHGARHTLTATHVCATSLGGALVGPSGPSWWRIDSADHAKCVGDGVAWAVGRIREEAR